jgi:hypothetical protein
MVLSLPLRLVFPGSTFLSHYLIYFESYDNDDTVIDFEHKLLQKRRNPSQRENKILQVSFKMALGRLPVRSVLVVLTLVPWAVQQ